MLFQVSRPKQGNGGGWGGVGGGMEVRRSGLQSAVLPSRIRGWMAAASLFAWLAGKR